MPKLVCVQCQVELVIEKSGAVCCDMFNQPPQPYKLWFCDAWKCPSCGTVILAGFADREYAEHYKPYFGKQYDIMKDKLREWFIHSFERIGDKDKYSEWKTEGGKE